MQRNFDEWFKHFRRGIATYNYYVDFAKVYKNLDKVKVELNILNSLIGEKNIESKFSEIVLKYPETLECIPLILAIRSNEVFVKDEVKEYLFKFDKMVYSMNDYIKFTKEICMKIFLIIYTIMFLVLKLDRIQIPAKTELVILWRIL